jgi:hypothetical protein
MKIEIDWNVILIIMAFVLFIYQERVLDVYMYAMGMHSPITRRSSSSSPQGSYAPPKMLFRQNGLLYLHSVNEPIIPGVNPLIFHTYQDYLNYCNFRQSQGIYTPVLQIQNGTIMPTLPPIAPAIAHAAPPPPSPPSLPSPPSPPQGNLAPSTNDVTEAFGDYRKNRKNSINPMDTNWGGTDFTDSSVGLAGPYSM